MTIVGTLLTVLLLVGARPVALSEPTLDPSDLAPDGPAFTWEDLLDWHEQLADVAFVTPWKSIARAAVPLDDLSGPDIEDNDRRESRPTWRQTATRTARCSGHVTNRGFRLSYVRLQQRQG